MALSAAAAPAPRLNRVPEPAPRPLIIPGGGRGAPSSAVVRQELDEQATLESRQQEVQWSASGETDWWAVLFRENVRVGDRVRTGETGSARLVYFEGTVTELGPETGLLVRRLERSPGGNLVTNFFQAAGTTVNRVVQLVDPAGRFDVETPAAWVFVRGTTPMVAVTDGGNTRVSNLPDGSGGLVDVQGKDPNATLVTLQPGEETDVVPGQPPSPPRPIGAAPAATQTPTPPSGPAPAGPTATRSPTPRPTATPRPLVQPPVVMPPPPPMPHPFSTPELPFPPQPPMGPQPPHVGPQSPFPPQQPWGPQSPLSPQSPDGPQPQPTAHTRCR